MSSSTSTLTSSLVPFSTLENGSTSTPLSSSYFSVQLAATDALPYYDRELETQPGLRSKVENEIAQELKKTPILSEDRLPPVYQVFQTRPDLEAELERVSKQQPSQHRLDTTRYTLPEPIDSASEQGWKKSVENAAVQLGHMDVRLKNVELLKKYGTNLWRLHNFQQETMIEQHSSAIEETKQITNEINRNRQREQTEAGNKLASLERKWTELISRGLQLEVANITAEHEVEVLRIQKANLKETMAKLDDEEEQ